MIEPGIRVFLQRPEEFTRRVLHPAFVLSVDEASVAAALEAPLDLEVDEDLLVYYEVNRGFVQQPARTTVAFREETADEASATGEPVAARFLVDFETTGYFMPAESRACYRVVTVNSDLTATVGDEAQCVLLDVSGAGFSVIAHADLAIGDVVRATLRYEAKEYAGTACVQSIKSLITGDTRYGLAGVESGRGSIRQGQEKMTAALQRSQLRRRSGNNG